MVRFWTKVLLSVIGTRDPESDPGPGVLDPLLFQSFVILSQAVVSTDTTLAWSDESRTRCLYQLSQKNMNDSSHALHIFKIV